MERGLGELDKMFVKFTGALRMAIRNPELILGIKSKLLPLTSGEEPAIVEKKQETVDGIKI
jgi:hypothetical protein